MDIPTVVRISRSVVACVAIDSSRGLFPGETLGARKAHLKAEAEECGFRVYRVDAHDMAEYAADLGEVPVEFLRTGERAIRRQIPLIVDFAVTHPILHKLRAEWTSKGIEVIDREALVRDRDAYRSRNMASIPGGIPVHGDLSEKTPCAKESRTSRDTSRARKAAAETHGNDSRIRHRQFEAFFNQARAEGAANPSQIADWLNARGVPTARGRVWTRENVHRILLAIERDKIAAEIHALIDSVDDLTAENTAVRDEEHGPLGNMLLQEEDIEEFRSEEVTPLDSRAASAEELDHRIEITDGATAPQHQEPEDLFFDDACFDDQSANPVDALNEGDANRPNDAVITDKVFSAPDLVPGRDREAAEHHDAVGSGSHQPVIINDAGGRTVPAPSCAVAASVDEAREAGAGADVVDLLAGLDEVLEKVEWDPSLYPNDLTAEELRKAFEEFE